MEFIELNDKKIWNDFVSRQKFSQFLQSWQWGEFHKNLGKKVWRFGVISGDSNQDEILASAQIIKYSLPIGQNYLYCPRGPILNKLDEEIFFKKAKEMAIQEKSIFFKFEPFEIKRREGLKIKKVKSFQPGNEWMLDLSKAEEILLAEMHQKTRYNLKIAEKKGVKIIRTAYDDNYFKKFWEVISNTYSRKNLKTHTMDYYKKILCLDDCVKLWTAEYKGETVTANLVSYFGDSVTYMHGGSNYKFRNLMAPYLLQWKTIKDAKNKGYKYYNFGGINDNESNEKSEWAGITKFKQGFGGFKVSYSGTYDLPIKDFKYLGYRFVRIFF